MEKGQEPRYVKRAPESRKSTGADVVALVPPPPAEIETRRRLPGTRLGSGRGRVEVEPRPESDVARMSLATRRYELVRRRRRKQILLAVAIILGLFPPMWAVYLVAWLLWRRSPRQQAMRRVRESIRSLERNQTGVALKKLQEAHLLDPSNTDALYWLGLLLSRQHRQEEAAEALSLVAERVPGLPEVEAALVDAYVATNDPDRALYHAQRLAEVDPFSPETPLKLADAFEAAAKPDLAIQALERAPLFKAVLTDSLMEIHYRLGVLLEQQGETDRALHHFKRVYASDATYGDARQRMEALERES